MVYVSWQADGLEEDLKNAAISDDNDGLRAYSAQLGLAQRVFTDWAINGGGQVITQSLGSGRICITPDFLPDLLEKQKQYQELSQNTVSIGIGNTLSEAEKALHISQSTDFNEITFYEPELEGVVQEDSDFDGDLDDFYLEGSVEPGLGDHGLPNEQELEEIKAKLEALPSLPDAKEMIENEALMGLIPDQPATSLEPERPFPPDPRELIENEALMGLIPDKIEEKDLPDPAELIENEALLGLIPDEGEADDAPMSDDEMDAQDEDNQQMLAEIANTLEFVNQHSDMIEGLQAINPSLYQSILNMVKALVDMRTLA